MDGGPPMESYRIKQKEHHEGLTGQLKRTFDKMRELAATIEDEELRRDMQGQIEVADVTQEALRTEFGWKP